MPAFLKAIDPKLTYAAAAFAAALLALDWGFSWDRTLEIAIAGAIALLVGYLVPNDATVLRTPQESGNPTPEG